MKITPSAIDMGLIEELNNALRTDSERPDEIDVKEFLFSDLFSPVDIENFQTILAGMTDKDWFNDRYVLVGLLHVSKFTSFLKVLRAVSSISLLSNDIILEKVNEDDLLILADVNF